MADIIRALWIGPSLGLIERLSITSFLRHGHEYHLYCYEPTAGIPAGTVVKDANAILPASEIFYYQTNPGKGSVAAFANLFRYKLLSETGGWWVDTDVVCLRPFDFPEPIVFASEVQYPKHAITRVTNAIMKFPAGHPVIRLCYESAAQQDRQTMRWGQTGPELVTRMVQQFNLSDAIKPTFVFCPLHWWKWNLLLEPDASHAQSSVSAKSYAIHLWHEMWRRGGINRSSFVAPPTSFFAELLCRYGVE